MTPEENAAKQTSKPGRRVVQFAELAERADPAERVPAQRTASDEPLLVRRDRWLRVAELVVGDWAPTLREALLRVVLFAIVLVALGVLLGAGISLLGAVIGVLMFLVGRRKTDSTSD